MTSTLRRLVLARPLPQRRHPHHWLRAEDLYVILDQAVGKPVFVKVLVKAARQPYLAWRLPLRLRVARGDVARRTRTAPARDAALARPGVTALILGALIAVAAVVVVALPFLRESSEPELIDSRPRDRGAAGAARGSRPLARGAEGDRVRPPHRQGRRRRLPRARRAAPTAGGRGTAGARCPHGPLRRPERSGTRSGRR